jgi:hypothetical protein
MNFQTQLEATVRLKGQEYIDAFVNRKSGSKWVGISSIQNIISLNWVEVFPHSSLAIDGCQYYQAKCVQVIGLENVIDLRKCQLAVDLREGSHGLELVCNENFHPQPTNEAYLIIGRYQDEQIIYTAFPGNLYCSIKKFPNLSVDELKALNIPFAVKSKGKI